MGCASSAALPFLTNRGNSVAESPRMNGKPPYELKMVNNKLKENGVDNVKDVNESYLTEKMKDAVDSTAVQGVIGGVVQTKDEIVNQVKGFKDAASEKATSMVDGVEETIESAFGKLTNSVEETLKLEDTEDASAVDDTKADDIDELLESLPAAEEEVAEAVQTTAEEVLEKAMDEVKKEETAEEGKKEEEEKDN